MSTIDQAEHGYGLSAQEQAVAHAAQHRGWELLHTYRDEGRSASTLQRPALLEALEQIAQGAADALIVAKLDRVSRSMMDFAQLLEWFDRAGAKLVALDLDIDTSTAHGELVAHMFAAVAQWERRIIGQRTREGLAEARRRGVQVSRPAVADHPDLAVWVREQRAAGLSYQAICDVLNAGRVPTLRGGRVWRRSALQTVLEGRSAPRRKVLELPAIRRRT